ncbi:MAG: hypothetical protein IIA83_06410 [Thaumarchaeota archaeon]|nr:hypothetical protein [Nitrososphaerota archaeon]
MSEPSMEIIPATDYGDPKNRIHPINKVLQESKSKNMTVLEILAKDSGCKINKKYSFIEDVAGRVILPSQLFESYGLLNGNVRCTICKDVFDWNTIMIHLEDDFRNGHKMNTSSVIRLFASEFYNYEYRNGKFQYKGEDIAA